VRSVAEEGGGPGKKRRDSGCGLCHRMKPQGYEAKRPLLVDK